MANTDRWLVLTDFEEHGPVLVDSRNIGLAALLTPEPSDEEPDPQPRTIITLANDVLDDEMRGSCFLVVKETPSQIGAVLGAVILYQEPVVSHGGEGCG